jgi:hypothetical protein
MGTRADFYIGKGKGAAWLGSIGMDGSPDAVAGDMSFSAKTTISGEDDWVESVAAVFQSHEEHTVPEMGWPWPWDDSNTTDYAYTFDQGQVWVSCFGQAWVTLVTALTEQDWDEGEMNTLEFPDMSSSKNIRWDAGNAPMIFGVKTDGSMGLVNNEFSVLEETKKVVDNDG